MKKEKLQNYFTTLSFLFLFEGIQTSLLYPIGPYLMTDTRLNFISDYEGLTEDQTFLQIVTINTSKGQIAFLYGFYMLIFYLFQLIGMIFWSVKINQKNFKICLIIMVISEAIAILVISMKISIIVTFIMRAFQGFFAASIGAVKLTIDNKFSPRRDMNKVVDFSGLWYLGLAIGCSLTSVLTYSTQQQSLNIPPSQTQRFSMIKDFPYLSASIINIILVVILITIIYVVFPELSKKKQQYRKMQSTMFFQSVFFLSQNEFTQVVTRHQRTRKTFEKTLMKQLLWQDRNLLFAFFQQGLVYMMFYGFFDIFSVYCMTVLEIKNELFLSNIFCASMFAAFLFQMFGLDVNFFEKEEESRKSNKSLVATISLGVVFLCFIYLLRLFTFANSYLLLVITGLVFMGYTVCIIQIITESNYLVEHIALQYKEDADHARNLAQLNVGLAKIVGPFFLCLCSAFNFWQINNRYFDFIYVYVLLFIFMLLSYFTLNCLDIKWRQPGYEELCDTRLYNSDLNSSKVEVFA